MEKNMKLTDFLQDVGRPVAYYPALRRVTGSTNATIMLCQFIYWRGKEADSDGWLYKTSDEIEEETGLSYGEQKTARRDLVSAGILEEHYARLDHQMRFKLNLYILNTKWGLQETFIPESGKPQLGNEENNHSLSSITEITSEITSLSDEEKAQANAKMDAILDQQRQAENAEVKGVSWTHREKFPEMLRPLADLCVRKFGKPSKKDLKLWLMEIGDWYDNGCTTDDFTEAEKITAKYDTPVMSPTGMTKAIKYAAQQRKNKPEKTKPASTEEDYSWKDKLIL